MVLVMDGSKNSNSVKPCHNGVDMQESAALLHELSAGALKRRSLRDLQQNSSLHLLADTDETTGDCRTSGIAVDVVSTKSNVTGSSDASEDGITTEVEGKQLRRLVLLHLDLIDEQQKQLVEKDKTISKLKNEKEQLEAKICRMERRMIVSTKTIAKSSNSDVAKTTDRDRASKRLSLPCSIESTKKTRKSTSSGAVLVTSKQFKDADASYSVHTVSHYLHDSQRRVCTVVPEPSIKDDSVMVPGWKVVDASNATAAADLSSDDIEMTCEETFLKRHAKLEADERRRKRWDIQRIRQENIKEALKQKQAGKDTSKKSDPTDPKVSTETITSLVPSLSRVLQIEVANELPISAFGHEIPSLPSREFFLPWFDADRKEVIPPRKPGDKPGRGRRKTYLL